ncbi:MAG: hypothetical protein WA130_15560 [Candidatus Methanoperedens sp.]
MTFILQACESILICDILHKYTNYTYKIFFPYLISEKKSHLFGLFEVNDSIYMADIEIKEWDKCRYKHSVLLTLLVYLRFMALGLRPQTPADAPPLAGFDV